MSFIQDTNSQTNQNNFKNNRRGKKNKLLNDNWEHIGNATIKDGAIVSVSWISKEAEREHKKHRTPKEGEEEPEPDEEQEQEQEQEAAATSTSSQRNSNNQQLQHQQAATVTHPPSLLSANAGCMVYSI